MKTLIALIFITLSFEAYSLEGHYQAEQQNRNCAPEFEISLQEDCLVLEYGAAAARSFCRINKGPRITFREIEQVIDGEEATKLKEYTTVVEAMIGKKLIISESIALKNQYGLTIKRVNNVLKFVKVKKKLTEFHSQTTLENMKLPLYKESKCSYKAE